jgi:HEAT repeat protein
MNIFPQLSRVAVCLTTLCIFGTTAHAFDEPSVNESELLAILRSDAADAEKALACKNLAIHGSSAAVSELAKLLPNERLSSWGRTAIEAIPGAASDEALRNAASSLEGRLLVGMINSIGIRKDEAAVALLSGHLQNSDVDVASAAAVALGRIGNTDATKMLQVALNDIRANVRSAVAEGCVLCAERLHNEGNFAAATEIYDVVRNTELPMQRIIEATRGAILARRQDGISLLMEILASDNKTMFQLALGTAREFPGSDVDIALASALDGATPKRAALIVQAMSDRADTVDLAVVLKAAEAGDNVVRLSAIEALQRIGDNSCLTALLNIAVGSEAELASAAKQTLAVLPGDSVDGEIGVMLPTARGDRQRLLLQLVGQRRIDSEVEMVENALEQSNASIRSAALVALGEIVPLNKLPVLIDQVVRPTHAEDVAIAQQALKAASVRMPDREACAKELANALNRAPSTAKTKLLEIISDVGGKTALQTLATAAVDKDTTLQDTSSRLLGKWNGVEAAPVLLDLAKKAPAEKFRVRALRGYIGLARKFAMPEKQRVAMCESAVKATNRSSEHKLVLDVLQLHPSAEGLRLAIRIMKNPALKNDASAAVMVIAQKVAGKGVDVKSLMAGVGLDKVKLEIISATYGAGSKTKDVTAQVGKQAGDLPLIALVSANYNKCFGGDPAPGVAKQLKIKYRINGKAGEATFAENALIILPTPES